MNVLIVAAHPDDEILGAGGTIVRHVQNGDKVFVCILSEGATARYGTDMIPVLREASIPSSPRPLSRGGKVCAFLSPLSLTRWHVASIMNPVILFLASAKRQ